MAKQVINQSQAQSTTLGYAQITSNFTTTSTSDAQVTGLTTTVTIPSGGRRVKITVFAEAMYSGANGVGTRITIWDGTVGSGTKLSQGANLGPATTLATPVIAMAVVTPAAGSKTYNVGMYQSSASGTSTLEAAATFPAFILVELI